MKKRVVVGISGGVDSGVAAWLLKQQGYEVVGLFMRNWTDTTGLKSGQCSYEDDVLFAGMVAKKIGIPFHEVDLSEEYRQRVVDYLFREYAAGRTPNPDVLCNREIKFDAFVREALKIGTDFVATGHYCRKETIEGSSGLVYRLLSGIDHNKDQSYFLCQLNQEQLSRALFPLGNLTKPEVREIARREQLANADRKDSQGICFVGKVDLPAFLQQQLKSKRGAVIEVPKKGYKGTGTGRDKVVELAKGYHFSPEMGEKIGEHQGAHYYTVGQRKGLDIGGKPEPLFVLATDVKMNIIYVGQGHDHPLLSRRALFIRDPDIHWIRQDLELPVDQERRQQVRIRYRQPLVDATLIRRDEGLFILFDQPQRAVAPGQFAAWYDGEELIGSGVID
ncbi:MAG: tRNA 2-thiouridine(34) synthase MnmA [Bacteroidales bacterium]|nr:tRNA 2-thiouridine(34) synthase MnmA [Bacteroidales bacterium]